MKAKAVILKGVDKLELEDIEVGSPGDNQVLLQIEIVGICGSDVHYWKDGKIGPFVIDKPMVIGHEGSGTVLEVGKSVEHLQPGDKVAIEPGYGCRMCEFCRSGRYNLCPKMTFCATPPVDGLLCEKFLYEADFCFKLPDNVSLAEGALMEPLSVGVHACNRACVKAGQKVAIMGAGPIGLSCLAVAKAFGVSKAVIGDLLPARLKIAEEMGADSTMKFCANEAEECIAKKIICTLGCQPDIIFECSSATGCMRAAMQATKAGGNVVLIGMAQTEVMMPLGEALFREVNILGGFRYANTYPKAIELVALGKIQPMPMVTHTFPLSSTVEAFETAHEKRGDAIKVHINANSGEVDGGKCDCKAKK